MLTLPFLIYDGSYRESISSFDKFDVKMIITYGYSLIFISSNNVFHVVLLYTSVGISTCIVILLLCNLSNITSNSSKDDTSIEIDYVEMRSIVQDIYNIEPNLKKLIQKYRS